MQSQDCIVRLANLADEEKILSLCWLAHEEMPERSLSPVKVQSMVRQSLTSDQGLIGVVDVGGDVRAMIGLIVSSPWCSEDLEIYDWLAFVRPDCRHLRYFTQLLLWAKGQAHRLHLPIVLGFIGDERVEAKARAYRRHMPKFGEFFRYHPEKAA